MTEKTLANLQTRKTADWQILAKGALRTLRSHVEKNSAIDIPNITVGIVNICNPECFVNADSTWPRIMAEAMGIMTQKAMVRNIPCALNIVCLISGTSSTLCERRLMASNGLSGWTGPSDTAALMFSVKDPVPQRQYDPPKSDAYMLSRDSVLTHQSHCEM